MSICKVCKKEFLCIDDVCLACSIIQAIKEVPSSVYIITLLVTLSLSCGVAVLPVAPAAVNNDFHTNTMPTVHNPAVGKMVMTVCKVDNLRGGLNLRLGRGTSEPVIGKPLADGAEVVVLGMPERSSDGGTWLYVANSGNVGYVNMRYLCSTMP